MSLLFDSNDGDTESEKENDRDKTLSFCLYKGYYIKPMPQITARAVSVTSVSMVIP